MVLLEFGLSSYVWWRHSCCLDHEFAVLDVFLDNDRGAVFVDLEDTLIHLFLKS